MPKLDRIQLQFSTTPLAASGVIRVLTKSAFSHVDLVVPRGIPGLLVPGEAHYGLLGASDPGGVLIRPPNYHEFLRRHRMTLVTDKAEQIFNVLKGEIGKPFDGEALLRVMDPNWRGVDWTDNGKWFCVELFAWILLKVNFWSHRRCPVRIDLKIVAPEDLIKYLAGEYDPDEFDVEHTD